MVKRFMLSVLAMVMLFSSAQATAFAETINTYEDKKEIPVVIERVDVPYAEAVKDPTFSTEKNLRSKAIGSKAGEGGWWDVYGDVEFTSDIHCRAVGRSALYSDDSQDKELIEIYHYTRTFFGTKLNPYGDSGREWGYNIVYAKGNNVTWSSVSYKTQKVFYGTEA